MSKKTKNILWIAGVCLVIAAAIVFIVREVAPSEETIDVENVEAVDTVVTMDSVIVDTIAVDTTTVL